MKARQIKTYLESELYPVFPTSEVPSRGFEARGGSTGAAYWTVMLSNGRIHPYLRRAEGPKTPRVELYGGSVQTVVGVGEGFN